MAHRFYLQEVSCTSSMTERHSRTQVAFYSNKVMREMYPDGNYEIVGEIGNWAKGYPGQEVIVTDTGRHIPIFPRGSVKKPFEWVAGYAAVGRQTYVCVVKSIIPYYGRANGEQKST